MAQVDYFLKIEGIEGESQDSKHKGEIDLVSWDWSEEQQGTSSHSGLSGSGAGKVKMADFQFKMTVNKAMPKLMLACATGEPVKSAILTCRRAGKEQQEYLKITFSDLLISSYKTGGNAEEVVPVDEIAFNYAKIEFEYKPQKPDGTLDAAVKAGYDLKKNHKV